MTKQEQFFYDNAGYSYNPKTETETEGRQRGAVAMAQAETYAREHNWSFSWEYEQERPQDVFGKPCPRKSKCNLSDCKFAHYNPRNEFFSCLLWDNGDTPKVIGSLGMIEAPTREYRRVVEAELALEAMPVVKQEVSSVG